MDDSEQYIWVLISMNNAWVHVTRTLAVAKSIPESYSPGGRWTSNGGDDWEYVYGDTVLYRIVYRPVE